MYPLGSALLGFLTSLGTPQQLPHDRVVQAGSLLLFDLLVVVPNTTYTALVTD
jgi:hypothetical protein